MKKFRSIGSFREHLPVNKNTFKKTAKKEVKLALINFALQNFMDWEYDIHEVGITLPRPFGTSAYKTKKSILRFQSPEKYIDLLENRFEKDWYYKFISSQTGDCDDVELLIFTEEDFYEAEKSEIEYLLRILEARKYLPRLSRLVKDEAGLKGRALLLKTNHLEVDLKTEQRYNAFHCVSKDSSCIATLEMTSKKTLADGIYDIKITPKEFKLFLGKVFEIEEARLIEKIPQKPVLPFLREPFLKETADYSKKDLDVKLSLLLHKIEIKLGNLWYQIVLFVLFLIVMLFGLFELWSIFKIALLD